MRGTYRRKRNMPRERWLIGYIDADEAAKHLLDRHFTWHTTLYWDRPNMGRESALRIARERGCAFDNGGRMVWYPVWPRNESDGMPRRRGAGSARETGKFD